MLSVGPVLAPAKRYILLSVFHALAGSFFHARNGSLFMVVTVFKVFKYGDFSTADLCVTYLVRGRSRRVHQAWLVL